MFCGAVQEEDRSKEAKPLPQTLNLKNYLRCLRILREKVRSALQGQREGRGRSLENKPGISESWEGNFSQVSQFTSLGWSKPCNISWRKKALNNLERKLNKNQKMSNQADSIQSMINFLKENPHKFQISICEGFLEKLGLKHEFSEVVDCYMADWTNKIDSAGLNSFLSDTNVVDLTNRSLMKTFDRSRRVEVKRANDLTSVLKNLEENAPKPSKHNENKPRLFRSCCPLKNQAKKSINIIKKLSKSRNLSEGRVVKKSPKLSTKIEAPIAWLDLLYINEVSQAISYQNMHFRPHAFK